MQDVLSPALTLQWAKECQFSAGPLKIKMKIKVFPEWIANCPLWSEYCLQDPAAGYSCYNCWFWLNLTLALT